MKKLRKLSVLAMIVIIGMATLFNCSKDNEPFKPADKIALQTAITEANDLLSVSTKGNEPGQYPETAMTAFTSAIDDAKEINLDEKATQKAVDNAVEALESAIDAFKQAMIPIPIINKSTLEASITEATSIYNSSIVGFATGQYKQTAKDDFQAAINAATDVKNNTNATQDEVDAAVTTLNTAKTTFTTSANVKDYDQYLSLYMKMDGNLNDESYYKHTGTLNKRSGSSVPQLTTDRFGQANKAYAFNGNNISIPNHSSLRPSNVSVSLWINPASITGAQAIYSMNWWDGYYFKSEGAQVFFASTSAGGAYVGSTTQISIGSWYHVVVTRSNSEFKIYVNGVLENTAAISTNTGMTIPDSQPFIIGALSYEADEYPFNGKIDEVRVYSKALTDAEVTGIYNQEKP